jgi:protein involved in polysaccharide export with SLBB domain
LLRGIHSDVERLQPGDTILVPTVGPQVAVTGMVRRPAIYELKGAESLKDTLEIAGGMMVSASLRQVDIERIEAHQRRTMLTVHLSSSSDSGEISGAPGPTDAARVQEALLKLAGIPAQDGDRIVVWPILPYNEQSVYLDGHVFRPGKYPYHEGMTINDLLHSYQDVMPEPADHAELIRLEAPDFRPVTINLNLPDVLQGNDPRLLKPFDVVRVFSRYEIDTPEVTINGDVLRPGEYPLAKGMTATVLINMAGGFTRSAYRAVADLATYTVQNNAKVLISTRTVDLSKALQGDRVADEELNPGDVLSIREMTGWRDIGSSVTVNGEVGHSGVYGISVGERLSSVLERAGGLRETAYPQGAILERVRVRELGERARMNLIQRLQSEDLTSMSGTGSGTPQEEMEMLQSMRQQQQQALSALQNQPASGRLVINVSADISKWKNTQADIEMRDGDILTFPKQASFVLVSGQVYSPSALTYVPGKNAGWYLSRAGNVTNMGNKKDIFVIRADGSVIGRRGHFKESVLSVRMNPGDSVVVPEKIVGTPMWKSLLTVAQMMSAVALTAAVAGGV